MGHSARFYFILLHLANLHFPFQCINVNSKMRERKKVPFIDFFVCNPQEQTQIYAETNYLIVFLQKLYL